MDFKKFSGLIMIEQTLFALPFAYIGILFAGGGTLSIWIWSTLALFGARSAGMSFNRLLDAEIDAKNPRTAKRHIPSGELSKKSVWIFSAVSSALLVFSAWMLNSLVFYLSFIALILLFTYSFFKRFSASSHFYLGIVEAAAPIGGYLAVTGTIDLICLIPGAAILFWIAGLDILYSIQDMEFDKKEGLHSIPSRFGLKTALRLSIISYFLAIASLTASGYIAGLGIFYWIGVFVIIYFFSRQQMTAITNLKNIQTGMIKIFYINRFISPVLLAGLLLDFIVKKIFF